MRRITRHADAFLMRDARQFLPSVVIQVQFKSL
jgi:hypothetical protein